MTELAQKITGELLALPREDREEIAEKLLQSLYPFHDTVIDRSWAEEAERRVKEYGEGKVEALDGEQVLDFLYFSHIYPIPL